MVKELDRVHTGTESRAENSDPSRSVSKVQALATASPGASALRRGGHLLGSVASQFPTSCTM